jgi:hypothetical protein
MPKVVPQKNIDPALIDVKRRDVSYSRLMDKVLLNLEKMPQTPESPPRKRKKRYIWAGVTGTVFCLLLLVFGFVFLNFNAGKDVIRNGGRTITANFLGSLKALNTFQPSEASAYLRKNDAEIKSIRNFLDKSRTDVLINIFGGVVPVLKDAKSLFEELDVFNASLLELSTTIEDVEYNGFKYFRNDGGKLVADLTVVRDAIRDIGTQSEKIKNTTAILKKTLPFFENIDQAIGEAYLKHSADLKRAEASLDNLLVLLDSGVERHIALFFQNPAEIRPGGGFIGSYADLTINHGQMVNLDVRDIYDPDGQLFKKITPPWPLQTMTQDWGARDANWFFDFPTSARTVLGFLEASKMYEEKGTVFDGVVALNIEIIETVLGVIGPIPLDEYKITIDRDNFLSEVQREVEAGKDKAAGQPKKILQVLAPKLLEKLGNLTPTQQKSLIEDVTNQMAKKDIMVYMKDAVLAGSLKDAGMDGSLYEIPRGFWGNYLAVVNANVAGGKSDAFITQSVGVKIDVDTEGGILTDLTLTRTHNGDKQKDPWWRETNKDFVQILTNPGSNLLNLTGNTVKNLYSDFDYKLNKYETNPDVRSIEDTKKSIAAYNAWSLEEFGKTAFATWLFTAAGKTSEMNVRYQTTDAGHVALEPGRVFTFVFERQSGVKSDLDVTIAAPVGFKWAETDGSFYNYRNSDPDGRIILKLTLTK